MNKPTTVLIILDGWGIAPPNKDNAIYQACTPQWDQWLEQGQHTTLFASGHSVGLPTTQVGNSEVGHMHIGAGRCIEQDLIRLDRAIDNGQLFAPMEPHIQALLQQGKALHITGLLSPGGVHSHEQHLFALLTWLRQFPQLPVYIHVIMDGRDTPPQSGLASLEQLRAHCHHQQILSSLCGRYYAMDRDCRWQRIQQAYDLLTTAQTPTSLASLEEILQAAYEDNPSDEFIPPTALPEHQAIQAGDALLCFNFRADRMRQLCHALVDQDFDELERQQLPKPSLFTLTDYDPQLKATVLLKPTEIDDHLGACVSEAGLKQLRLAETEKYPHVTYFFNGGQEKAVAGEDRQMIPSPKVSTYDQQPEMSAQALTQTLVDALAQQQYSLVVCNYANADMVGHTGNLEATIKAIETLDNCFSQIQALRTKQALNIIITADHGNAEKMFHHRLHQPHTSHTQSLVPFLYLGDPQFQLEPHPQASLIDIAPSILTLMSLPIPQTMTGHSLLHDLS